MPSGLAPGNRPTSGPRDKGCFHPARRQHFLSDLDGELTTLLGNGVWNVAETDGFSEAGRGAARSDPADRLSVAEDELPRSRHTSIDEFKADQLVAVRLEGLLFHGFVSHESATESLDETLESRFEGRGFLIEFMAVQGEGGFETECIPCSQACGSEAFGLSFFEQLIEE